MQKSLKKKKAAKSVLGILATWMFLYPVSIVVSILVSRTLGPLGKGIFTFAKVWSGFPIPFMTLGFQAGVLYYLSNEDVTIDDIFFTVYISGLIFGFLIGGGIFFALKYNFIGRISHNLNLLDKLMIGALLVVNTLLMLTNRVLKGIGLFGLMNLMNIYKSLFLLSMLIFFVLIEKLNYHGAIFSMFLSQTLALVVILTQFLIQTNTKVKITFNHFFFWKSLKYGFKAYWANLANVANQRADQFIISIFVPASELGFYSVAANLAELPWILVRSFNPVFFKHIAVANRKERIKLTNRIIRVTLLLFGIIYFSLFVVSDKLIILFYGDSFRFSATIIKFYIPGALLYALVSIFSKYFLAIGKPEKSSCIQILSAVVGIITYLMLIQIWGVIGAAAASSITYVFTSIFAFKMYEATIKPDSADLFFVNKEDVLWLKRQLVNIIK